MAIQEEMVTITASDGHKLDGFIAHAEGAPNGGLVILQEIFGLTDQLKSVARSYAVDGYTTIVPALFDRVSPQTVVPFDNPERGQELRMRLDVDKVLLDIDAAKDIVNHGRGVSVLGFCFGGGIALKAASTLNIVSAISYYGTRLPNFLDVPPRCPTLFHFGATDMKNTPPEVIEAVQTAIPNAEIHIYDAGHAFANDARKTFVPDVAETARDRSQVFLDKYHD